MDSFFSLPFNPGTRLLPVETLNKYSKWRRPDRGFGDSWVREAGYADGVLTLKVKMNNDPIEMVYLKVTECALLVSCSVDTDENYLSRHAYYALFETIRGYTSFDLDKYFWPDFFDSASGRSKFVEVDRNRYGNVRIDYRRRYDSFYKPGHVLPALPAAPAIALPELPTIVETVPEDGEAVLGFCLADVRTRSWFKNHWPFLSPYVGVLDLNKTAVKGFKSFVLDKNNLFLPDLDGDQQRLLEICVEMRQLAVMDDVPIDPEPHLWIVQEQITGDRFKRLFELWQEAMPILAGRLYKHYFYSHGLKNVKGKPRKRDMKYCSFSREVPQICFIWREYEDYYKLELRIKLGKQLYQPFHVSSTTFFVNTMDNPRVFHLLGSLIDCQLMNFFYKSNYKMLILKVHYERQIKDFVDELRGRYQFIKR